MSVQCRKSGNLDKKYILCSKNTTDHLNNDLHTHLFQCSTLHLLGHVVSYVKKANSLPGVECLESFSRWTCEKFNIDNKLSLPLKKKS